MVDPDTLRYLRIAQADLVEARRMLELTGFRDSSSVSSFNSPAKQP
jgi:hypothetical protein